MVDDSLKPLGQFSPDYRRYSPHNQKLLDEANKRNAKILSKEDLKKYQVKLSKLNKMLKPFDTLVSKRSELIDNTNHIKRKISELKDEEQTPDIKYKLDQLGQKLREHYKQAMSLTQKIAPARKALIERDIVKARIDEHEATARALAQEAVDAQQMAKEANLYAQLIIRTWNRLGYKYEVHKGNRIVKHSVRFEHIYTNADEIQFKVDVSQLGLFDGTVHNLPQGIRAYNLVEPDTLRELNISLEREIESPNLKGECDWAKGVWLRLYRQNYSGGISNYEAYDKVMSRYPVDDRDKYPLPLGVKSGRFINWVNLTDHPHLLVAGQTGSGKTNAIRVILSTLCMMHSPHEIRYCLIDLKRGGDLNPFANTPHAIGKVIKSVEDVATLMKQMEILMNRRMDIISPVTNDIVDYNRIVAPEHRLPRILIVFDEFGAIKSAGKDLGQAIEQSAIMLATQARASGIQMLIGIQQSYSDSVHKQIKGNITFVLGGRQRTQGSSMSVFSNASAMDIKKIPGRMICDDGNGVYQVQIPYATHENIKNAIGSTAKWESVEFRLPDLASDEDGDNNVYEPFGQEMVIRFAIKEFDGVVKGREIWELINRKDVSRTKVMDVCRDIRSKDEIEFEGQIYKVIKDQGRTFRLELNPEILKSHPLNV